MDEDYAALAVLASGRQTVHVVLEPNAIDYPRQWVYARESNASGRQVSQAISTTLWIGWTLSSSSNFAIYSVSAYRWPNPRRVSVTTPTPTAFPSAACELPGGAPRARRTPGHARRGISRSCPLTACTPCFVLPGRLSRGFRGLARVRGFLSSLPGVRVLRVSIVPEIVGLTPGRVSVTIPGMDLPSEATWLDDGEWSGVERSSPSVYSLIQNEFVAWVDVSDVLVGSISTIPVTFTAGTLSSGSAGIHNLSIAEMPNAFPSARARSRRPRVNSAALLPGSELYDGSTTTSGGLVRLLDEVQRWRSQWPRTVQLVGAKTAGADSARSLRRAGQRLIRRSTRAKRLGKSATYTHKHTRCACCTKHARDDCGQDPREGQR